MQINGLGFSYSNSALISKDLLMILTPFFKFEFYKVEFLNFLPLLYLVIEPIEPDSLPRLKVQTWPLLAVLKSTTWAAGRLAAAREIYA